MRRILASVAVASVLLAGAGAWAQEDTAPVTVADTPSSETTTADSGGGALHAKGALFDKDDATHRKMMFSLFAEIPWYYTFAGFALGAGARFAIPIVKGGFVPAINDSFWIEFGVDTEYYFFVSGFSFGLTIPAQAMYMIHLLKNLAVYAKLSLGIHIQVFTYSTVWQPVYFHGAGGLGLVYNLSDAVALRAEVLSSGFYGGIAFLF